MTPPKLRRIVVVGGSVAAVTAADTLRSGGFDGELEVLSSEAVPPYSRVPLSKGVLAGSQDRDTVWLEPLPDSIDVRLNSAAVGLNPQHRRVRLRDGTDVPYDGLVIASGATPVRLARPEQDGELVVRELQDATVIADRVGSASTAVVVGGGFLGMEVASTLNGLGLSVTVIDREPPLRRLLGAWLSGLIVDRARELGVRVVIARQGVELVGNPVAGVRYGDGEETLADLTITAAGERPAVDWLTTSGLPIAGGLVVDRCCRVSSDITAAGDVTVVREVTDALRRTPHWTSAVEQARTAARALLSPGDVTPYVSDPYFWTEQFGLDVKISGHPPAYGDPTVLTGDPSAHRALVQWTADGVPRAAVSINHKMPISKLKTLRTHRPTPDRAR